MSQITVVIEGKERTFHFGLNTWNQFIIMRNKRLKELDDLEPNQELTISDVGKQLLNTSKYYLEANTELLYCALVSACKLNSKPIDFNVYQVGEWVNEMEQEQLATIMETLAQSKYLGKTWSQWGELIAQTEPQQETQTLA